MNKKIKLFICLLFGLYLSSSVFARSAYDYGQILVGDEPTVWCGNSNGFNYELIFNSDHSFEYGIYSHNFPEVISVGENGFESEKYNVVHGKGSFKVLDDSIISICFKDIDKVDSVRFDAKLFEDIVWEIKLIDDESAVFKEMLFKRHYR